MPKGFERATAVKLLDGDGKAIAAQIGPPRLNAPQQGPLVRELDFILPQLDAGQSARFTAEISTSAPRPITGDICFIGKTRPAIMTLLSFGDRPVMQYMYHPLDDSTKAAREKTYKVYHHVFDSTGKVLLTKGPGGQDSHHRGLFYGFNRVTYDDGKKHANVWQCSGDGYQSHEGFLCPKQGPCWAGIYWPSIGMARRKKSSPMSSAR